MHHTHYLWFETKKRQEIIDITAEVEQQATGSGIPEGFVLVSAMHICASVFVNDHESGLWEDILGGSRRASRRGIPELYRHNRDGRGQRGRTSAELTVGHEVIVPITTASWTSAPGNASSMASGTASGPSG